MSGSLATLNRTQKEDFSFHRLSEEILRNNCGNVVINFDGELIKFNPFSAVNKYSYQHEYMYDFSYNSILSAVKGHVCKIMEDKLKKKFPILFKSYEYTSKINPSALNGVKRKHDAYTGKITKELYNKYLISRYGKDGYKLHFFYRVPLIYVERFHKDGILKYLNQFCKSYPSFFVMANRYFLSNSSASACLKNIMYSVYNCEKVDGLIKKCFYIDGEDLLIRRNPVFTAHFGKKYFAANRAKLLRTQKQSDIYRLSAVLGKRSGLFLRIWDLLKPDRFTNGKHRIKDDVNDFIVACGIKETKRTNFKNKGSKAFKTAEEKIKEVADTFVVIQRSLAGGFIKSIHIPDMSSLVALSNNFHANSGEMIYKTKEEILEPEKMERVLKRKGELEGEGSLLFELIKSNTITEDDIKTKLLSSNEDYQKEGKKMGHCVGSYSDYLRKGNRVHLHLYSKSLKESNNSTLEIGFDNKEVYINQHKSYHNSKPSHSHSVYANELVDRVNKHLKEHRNELEALVNDIQERNLLLKDGNHRKTLYLTPNSFKRILPYTGVKIEFYETKEDHTANERKITQVDGKLCPLKLRLFENCKECMSLFR